MLHKSLRYAVSVLVFGFASHFAMADGVNAVPVCMGEDSSLSVDNQKVLNLKKVNSAKIVRAYASGKISKVFPHQCNNKGTCHEHFEIQIGSGAKDTVEVIYSTDFGDMPKLDVGLNVAACGDFINTSAQANTGPKSPSGAILHWVHKSGCMDHESGFVMIQDRIYGFGPDKSHHACGQGVAERP